MKIFSKVVIPFVLAAIPFSSFAEEVPMCAVEKTSYAVEGKIYLQCPTGFLEDFDAEFAIFDVKSGELESFTSAIPKTAILMSASDEKINAALTYGGYADSGLAAGFAAGYEAGLEAGGLGDAFGLLEAGGLADTFGILDAAALGYGGYEVGGFEASTLGYGGYEVGGFSEYGGI